MLIRGLQGAEMDEAARLERNQQRLTECYGPYALKVRGVLDALEAQQFRPRIQDAYRSEADQLIAFNTGHSKVKFGFHNIMGASSTKEALACDVLDDDSPLAPGTRYLLALALAARANELETGILWGLPPALTTGVEAALAIGDLSAPVKVGWDPTHVQVVRMTAVACKGGARPVFGATPPVAPAPPAPPNPPPVNPPPAPPQPAATDVVQPGDTLIKIAKRHGLTLARLLALNSELATHPNLIRPGDVIVVG